jgi:hypothetical protein
MKSFILLFFTTFTAAGAYGQTVALDFPHFAGSEWTFTAFRGEKRDTLATGTLDAGGRAVLRMPASHRNYRGMTQWLLAKGGGLSMIVAGGENFSVSCAEAQPSEENIIYKNTSENNYLNSRYKRQQDILGKIDAMRMAVEAYGPLNPPLGTSQALSDGSAQVPLEGISVRRSEGEAIRGLFQEELQKQEQSYKLLQAETASNPLYAARFAQVVDVTRGLPPVPASGPDEIAGLLNDYVLDSLDLDALYTSGHWAGVLEQLMDWYSYKEENRAAFIPAMTRLVKRALAEEVYAALAGQVTVFCEKKGWHDQELEFAFFLLNDDRIREPEGKVASLYTLLKLRKGSKAPALSRGSFPGGNVLLVFYESGCNACDNELQQLKGNYSLLREKGYEVVSISADKEEQIFRNTSDTFPWRARYCDFRGFSGTDFTNYGVMGTPTFYVIDGKGMIQGRYARVEDIEM